MTYYSALHRGEGGHGDGAPRENANSKQRMRWTDKYCSFPEIMAPPRPHPPLKEGIHICIRGGFVKHAVMTPIPNDVTVGEERGKQLKKKARMIQSLRISDFRRKMDIRVET